MTTEPPLRKPLLLGKGFWFGLALIVPLVACVAWTIEDMYGQRQLAETKARLRAAGLDLSPAALSSKPVPDDQNFCASPALLHALRSSGSARAPVTRLRRQLGLLTSGSSLSRLGSPTPTDWSGLQRATRSKTKVAARAPDPDSLEARISVGSSHPQHELAAALEEKLAEVVIDLETRLDLPQAEPGEMASTYALAELIGLLEWRAHLALFVGDVDRGVRTWRILWRIGGDRVYGKQAATDWLFTALRDRQLNDPQLRQIAGHAVTGDLLTLARRQLLSDLASLDSRFEEMHGDRDLRGSWGSSCSCGGEPSTTDKLIGYALPWGWFDANRARCYTLTWDAVKDLEREGLPWSISPVSVTGGQTRMGMFSHDRTAAFSGMRDFRNVRIRLASSHIRPAFAVAGCALERFFLVHHEYPPTLAALVPDFLRATPVDLDGRPLRYARDLHNERYKLWSVGTDGVDDGGRAARPFGRGGGTIFTRDAGDWVWQYP